MEFPVIVFDPSSSAGDAFASLVATSAGVPAKYLTSAGDVLDAVLGGCVRVVVLTHCPPDADAVDLFRKLADVDPHVKAIMLVDGPNWGDVPAAYESGFALCLRRDEVDRLPDEVLIQLARYRADLAKALSFAKPKRIGVSRRRFPLVRERVALQLVQLEVIKERCVLPETWTTVRQIKRGETIEETRKVSVAEEFVYGWESQEKLKAELGTAVPTLELVKAGLEAEITARFQSVVHHEGTESLEVKTKWVLPDEPANPEQRHVVARDYQEAPVYRRIRCLLMRTCSCCGTSEPIPVTIHQLVAGDTATQQIDYFSDGTYAVIGTWESSD